MAFVDISENVRKRALAPSQQTLAGVQNVVSGLQSIENKRQRALEQERKRELEDLALERQRQQDYLNTLTTATKLAESTGSPELAAQAIGGMPLGLQPQEPMQPMQEISPTQEPEMMETPSAGFQPAQSTMLSSLLEGAAQRGKEKRQEKQSAKELKNLQLKKIKQELDPTYQAQQRGQKIKDEITISFLKKQQDLDMESKQVKRLGAKDVQNIAEGANIPNLLNGVSSVIDDNIDKFGVVVGRAAKANPNDVRAQTINAQLRSASQAFGRFMEGGVLRKEDEEKYREMFPQLKDNEIVAKNKLVLVRRLLAQKYNQNINALKESRFDVSGLPQELEVPPLPSEISGARGERVLSPEDQEAINWAKKNPGNEDAKAILRLHGVQ